LHAVRQNIEGLTNMP